MVLAAYWSDWVRGLVEKVHIYITVTTGQAPWTTDSSVASCEWPYKRDTDTGKLEDSLIRGTPL